MRGGATVLGATVDLLRIIVQKFRYTLKGIKAYLELRTRILEYPNNV